LKNQIEARTIKPWFLVRDRS